MINKVAISVIIPCYNAELYIKDCLKSLLGQNIKNFFEIIVIDDASKDKTVEIIKKFKLSKIKFFSLKKIQDLLQLEIWGYKKQRESMCFI